MAVRDLVWAAGVVAILGGCAQSPYAQRDYRVKPAAPHNPSAPLYSTSADRSARNTSTITVEAKASPGQRNATKIEVAAMLAALQYDAKDADSIKVRNVKVATGGNDKASSTVICGEVNGKNSYGGYTGFKLFYGLIIHETKERPMHAASMLIGTDRPSRTVVEQSCQTAGIFSYLP